MDVNFVSLQQSEWPVPEWRTPETYEHQGMYWYNWQSPGYLLMTSCISVCSSKLSHSHLTVQDCTVLNYNSTEIRGEKNIQVSTKTLCRHCMGTQQGIMYMVQNRTTLNQIKTNV